MLPHSRFLKTFVPIIYIMTTTKKHGMESFEPLRNDQLAVVFLGCYFIEPTESADNRRLRYNSLYLI